MKKYFWIALTFSILTAVATTVLIAKTALAYPGGLQQFCPAPPNNQTIHGLWIDPSALTAQPANTTMYAQSYICTSAPYTTAGNVIIYVDGITNMSGNGGILAFSPFGNTTTQFNLGNINGRGTYSITLSAAMGTNNNPPGTTCYDVRYHASAVYGGVTDVSGPGHWYPCVTYNPPVNHDPTISVSNPDCSSTTFTITSGDQDAGAYTVRWHIRRRASSAAPWSAWSAWSGNIGGFSGAADTVTVNLNQTQGATILGLTYNKTYQYQIQADTAGFAPAGSPATSPRIADASSVWGPCALGFDFTPDVSLSVTPSVFGYIENPDTASFTPSITNSGNDAVNNINWSTQFYIRYADGSPNTDLSCGAINGTINMPAGDYNGFPNCSKPLAGYSLSPGDQICAYLAINPGTGEYDDVTNNWIGGTISARNSGAPPTNCYTISNLPYTKFFGGDAFAGGSFKNAGTCADFVNASIWAFNYSSNNVGSSSQYGLTAMGPIEGMSSANLGSAGLAKPPVGLSFSNGTGFILGGNFGGSNCITDYWKTKNGTPITASNINLGAAAYTASGAYRVSNGGAQIDVNNGVGPGATVSPVGSHRVFYFDGDIHISNDILFQNETGTYANEDQIPALYMIVRGNIYIDPGVHEINGIFIAQEKAANVGGTIYTCAPATGPYPSPTILNASHFLPGGDCNTQLRVFGTFLAQHVKLLRTLGSLRNGRVGESSTDAILDVLVAQSGGAFSCSTPTNTCQNSGEAFILSPEIYVTKICRDIPTVCSTGSQEFSITGLPPIL